MQRDGYRPSTIESHGKILRFLARNSNLDSPDQIKDFVAERKISLGRKENIVDIYARYAKYHGIQFSEPRYARQDTLPFVPLQQELETLINATRNLRHAALLRLLYETGMRVGEASQLRFKDFDFEKGAVRVVPEKGSRARELRLSDKACSMLRDAYSKDPKSPLPDARTARRYLGIMRVLFLSKVCCPRVIPKEVTDYGGFRAGLSSTWSSKYLSSRLNLPHNPLSLTGGQTQPEGA